MSYIWLVELEGGRVWSMPGSSRGYSSSRVRVCPRKHPYTPHPIFVFLALTQALLAGLYVLRALLRDSDVWVFPFRPRTPTPHPAAVLAPALLAPALLALLAPLGALVVLFVFLPVARWVPFGESAWFLFGFSFWRRGNEWGLHTRRRTASVQNSETGMGQPPALCPARFLIYIRVWA
ncbi:hypothetical protein B0H14DRAFT_3500369 [Mycena olivaceomarginata]|nr:hypothetical protein B0H14DRAFT_3500369 [Mycena olivaceomarginata]